MKFPFVNSGEFVAVNSFARAFAFLALLAGTFALAFLALPFEQWRLHFFQAGIFGAGFVFGPLAGLAVGALSSSYNALFVLHNPWILGGNALLGFFAAFFYKKYGAFKAVMLAYAIQIPYVYATDVYLMGMPHAVVLGIIGTLAVENAICALAAGMLAPALSRNL